MKPLPISVAILSIMCSACITPITLHTGLKNDLKNKIQTMVDCKIYTKNNNKDDL